MARGAFWIANVSLFLSAAAWAQAPGSPAAAGSAPIPPGSETRLMAPAKPQPAVPPASSESATAAAASASTWQDAFPAAAVASYLAPKVRILVATAGEDRATSQAATSALLRALRGSDRVQLVMTDATLGSLEGLSDEAFVAKAKGLPVDLVTIVRGFPAGDGLGTAVVIHYSREDGEVAFAWAAAPNAPLEARELGEAVSAGVGAQAVEQVAAVAKEGSKAEEVSKAEYDENFIGYDDFVLFQPRIGGAVQVGEQTKFYRGIYKRDLPLPDLFTLVGRTDLRKKYDQNQTLKVVTMVAGVGLMGASLLPLFMIADAELGDLTPAYLGLGLATGGVVLWMVGLVMNPNPVPMHEVRALADGYNRKLKGEAPVAGDKVSALGPIDVSFGLAPLDGGAIAGVSGRFQVPASFIRQSRRDHTPHSSPGCPDACNRGRYRGRERPPGGDRARPVAGLHAV